MLFSIGIAPKDVAVLPSKEVREYIVRTTKLILPMCASIYNVNEAEEPLYTAMVSGMRLMALAGGLSGKMHYERSVEDALAKIYEHHEFSISYVMEKVDTMRRLK